VAGDKYHVLTRGGRDSFKVWDLRSPHRPVKVFFAIVLLLVQGGKDAFALYF